MNKLTKLEKYWVLYDVGNSAFVLLVSTIIPIYFKNLATEAGISLSDSTAYYSYAISISTLIVALAGPMLGSIGDRKGVRKPIFTFFMMMGVLGLAALSIPVGWIVFLAIFTILCWLILRHMSGLIKFLHTDMLGAISVVVFLLQSVYY